MKKVLVEVTFKCVVIVDTEKTEEAIKIVSNSFGSTRPGYNSVSHKIIGWKSDLSPSKEVVSEYIEDAK